MKQKGFTRRDFLKLLGIGSLLAPASRFIHLTENEQPSADPATQPNIIILLFDTLSAHHMSLYGYQRKTTPNIDLFAKPSTVFYRHYASSNFTHPSTASLLTGVYPWSHRALNFYTEMLKYFTKSNIFSKLNSDFFTQTYTHNEFVMTILEQFKCNIDSLVPVEELTTYNPNGFPNSFQNDYPMGFYATKRWREEYIGPSSSLFLNPIFEVMETISSSNIQKANAEQYPLGLSDNQEKYIFRLEDAIDWIAKSVISAPQPYFGYFHLLPPHEAYRPRKDFLGKFSNDGLVLTEKPEHFFSKGQTHQQLREFRDKYDEYIAFVDAEFGRLFRTLEENKALENTYFILTSDHGQLFERGIHGHGITLFEPLTHIPLIIHAPGQSQGKKVFTPTSITDIMPTVLKLANKELPSWMEGKLLPTFNGKHETERTIFSVDGRENAKLKPLTKATLSAVHWPYKLIHYRGYSGLNNIDELFNLENDPQELDNIAAHRPSTVADLKHEIHQYQLTAEKRALGSSINQN